MNLEQLEKTMVKPVEKVVEKKETVVDVDEEPKVPARLLPFHLSGYRIHQPTVPCARELEDATGEVKQYHIILVDDEAAPGRVRYAKMFGDGHLGAVED